MSDKDLIRLVCNTPLYIVLFEQFYYIDTIV